MGSENGKRDRSRGYPRKRLFGYSCKTHRALDDRVSAFSVTSLRRWPHLRHGWTVNLPPMLRRRFSKLQPIPEMLYHLSKRVPASEGGQIRTTITKPPPSWLGDPSSPISKLSWAMVPRTIGGMQESPSAFVGALLSDDTPLSVEGTSPGGGSPVPSPCETGVE